MAKQQLTKFSDIQQHNWDKGGFMAIDMTELLQLVVDEGVSDLHIEVGAPPMVRLHGSLTPLDVPVLNPDDTERMVKSIASESQLQQIQQIGTVDFGFGFGEKARFRVSAFKQKGHFGTVLRQIPSKLLTLEQIGLPNNIKDLLYRPRGMILVTGPTGSGKSTTLASMINIINMERDCHIITVEDPIEFYHQHKRSMVIQREIGVDTPSFKEALKRSLRQDPDIIMVGEMRDLETMEAAVSAAETGHLVFATLHTTGAARTVDRIVDAFPTNQQAQIRTQLASSLLAVISQVLLPRQDKPGRVAAFEIMVSTPSIQALIRDSKTFRITSELQTGAKYGMNTLDSHLLDLYMNKIISYTELITAAQDPESITEKLQSKK
jgi:twitching motility protein PilT